MIYVLVGILAIILLVILANVRIVPQSQAFVIDNGTAPKTLEEKKAPSIFEQIIAIIKSMKIFTLLRNLLGD